MKKMSSVEAYIDSFPGDQREILKKMRQTIKKAAPEAEEKISYGMPGYKWNKKVLCYFGGFKNHIGFFATPAANVAFKKELAKYAQGKGSIQFPLDKKIPYVLVKKMVQFKVSEIRNKSKKK
jgi:uncharacterized protein YdhG (YjbR/CyaY superfamily)